MQLLRRFEGRKDKIGLSGYLQKQWSRFGVGSDLVYIYCHQIGRLRRHGAILAQWELIMATVPASEL